MYQNKQDYQELLQIYEIDQQTFDTWLANAKYLKENPAFMTSKGKPRLFDSSDTLALLPASDKFADDKKMMTQMTNKFRELYQDKRKRNNKRLLENFVIYTLTHCQYHKNHISFSKPLKLADYVEILTQLVFKKDIRLTVYNIDIAPKKEGGKWQKIIAQFPASQIEKKPIDSSETVYQRGIRVELSLASQTEKQRLEKRSESDLPIRQWTVRTLQIFCHYVYIMMGERMNIDG
ncbi:hypothetical protein [Psychrobacter sp. I-STPA6b]|uniref:hypothetical protein n=1 Tax=Psychrobacter sp. I-STPA6b TaxID=2585718 RepID=UPI001D0CCEB3|nr:hypothetical protein [Psychrobacter sp. I-STPA6b]